METMRVAKPEERLLVAIRSGIEALPRAEPGAPAALLRATIRDKCVELVATAPYFAVRKNIVSSFLWKHCIYAPISVYRRSLRRVRALGRTRSPTITSTASCPGRLPCL